MKLKTSTAITLLGAINHVLTGRPMIVRKNNQDEVVVQPYKLGSDISLKLAINAGKLRATEEAYRAARNQMIRQLSDGTATPGSIQPGSTEAAALVEQDEAALSMEVNLPLHRIDLAALKLDDNPGLQAVLEPLFPILKFDAPKLDADEQ